MGVNVICIGLKIDRISRLGLKASDMLLLKTITILFIIQL